MSVSIQFVHSLANIAEADWQDIVTNHYPFSRYAFLHALEASASVSEQTGWYPEHLLVNQDDELIAILPGYQKHHSYGEYVFDHQWAYAYQRHGLAYYPKLINAIPFTPATGPRLLVKTGIDENALWPTVIDTVREHCQQQGYSSWHCLFPDEATSTLLSQHHLPQRLAVQFHWFNQGYQSFDDFLQSFASRKRKNLRKERARVLEQDISVERLTGDAISDAHWRCFYHFYQLTYARLSGHGGYLNEVFFQSIRHSMADQILMVVARREQRIIAGALYFFDDTTLYGRYWGCYQEFDFLHFEACYYQGIEFCIERGLQRFDPGAQGEHKIQRGFIPVFTYSNHLIIDNQFATAVKHFLDEEKVHIAGYRQQCCELLPFKKDD